MEPKCELYLERDPYPMQPLSLTLIRSRIKQPNPDQLEIQFSPSPLMRWVPMGLIGMLGLFLFLVLALLIPLRTEVLCRYKPTAECIETDHYFLRRSTRILPIPQIQKVSTGVYQPKNGSPVYPIRLESPSAHLVWEYAQTPQLAEQVAEKLRQFLANPQAQPLERKSDNDYLPFWIMGAFFAMGAAFILRYFYQMMTGSVSIQRAKGQLDARLWSKRGPQFQRFEVSQIDRFRVESHGPICLIWMEVKDDSGPWILTWGISTGEGLRLEEKLSEFLGLD